MFDEKDIRLLREMFAEQRQSIMGEVSDKLDSMKSEITEEVNHRMTVLLDAEVTPKFNLLAEGISIIQEKMFPVSRIEDLENKVEVLELAVRHLSRELADLKQAN